MRGSSLRYMGHFLRNNHNATPATMAAARTETSHIACVASKRKSISQPSAPSAVGLAAPDRAAISLFKWMAGGVDFSRPGLPSGRDGAASCARAQAVECKPVRHDRPRQAAGVDDRARARRLARGGRAAAPARQGGESPRVFTLLA